MENKEIKVVDSYVLDFIKEKNLENSFAWLVDNVSKFFEKADYFEIDFCGGEDVLLCLRVFSNYNIYMFSDIRYKFCSALRENGYKELYTLLAVFQRRNRKEIVDGY